MKGKFILLLAFIFTGLTSFAQEQKLSSEKVPATVKSAFQKKFPKVANPAWELEDATIYEAEFTENGKNRSAKFDATGEWIESETEIKFNELPPTVLVAVSKTYTGQKIKEASKVESQKYGNCFEVEIHTDTESLDILLDEAGEVLRQKAEPLGSDDKD